MSASSDAGARRVAILGAGMAGAAAARRLHEAGCELRVFDKGRAPGGRMAGRRVPEADLRFDHGTQYLRARGPAFAARLAEWRTRGVAALWEGDRYVGTPGMGAPVRDLLDGLDVRAGATVVRLARDAPGWTVTDLSGVADGPYAAVAVTFPAPQTVALLEAGGLSLPGAEDAAYAPCWTLLVDLDADPGLTGTILEPEGGPIDLVAREATKPGRAASHALVVHATAAWSRAHLEEPREAVQAALLAALADVLGRRIVPRYAAVHRWRYAEVERALGVACLYDPAQRLGAAGDWCLGARVEGAYDSGLALAERILADLGPGSRA